MEYMHACTFKGCTFAIKCTLHRAWMKWTLHLGTVLAGWMELSLAMNAPHGKNKTHLTSGALELYSYIIIIMHDDITSWQICNTWIVVPRTHALQARVYNYRVILLKGCMFPCVYIAMIALSMYVCTCTKWNRPWGWPHHWPWNAPHRKKQTHI